jgi:hypothetical protein
MDDQDHTTGPEGCAIAAENMRKALQEIRDVAQAASADNAEEMFGRIYRVAREALDEA